MPEIKLTVNFVLQLLIHIYKTFSVADDAPKAFMSSLREWMCDYDGINLRDSSLLVNRDLFKFKEYTKQR